MNLRNAVFISLATALTGITSTSYAQDDHADSYYTTDNAYAHGVKPEASDRASDDGR